MRIDWKLALILIFYWIVVFGIVLWFTGCGCAHDYIMENGVRCHTQYTSDWYSDCSDGADWIKVRNVRAVCR